jgi:hypothetical protein
MRRYTSPLTLAVLGFPAHAGKARVRLARMSAIVRDVRIRSSAGARATEG